MGVRKVLTVKELKGEMGFGAERGLTDGDALV